MEFKTLKNIINNGGATLNKDGEAVNFKKGYQVSKKDCYKLDVGNASEVLNAINKLLSTIKADEFAGVWIEGGLAYVDVSIKIDNLQKALTFGRAYDQISIFDWNTKKCIYCNN